MPKLDRKTYAVNDLALSLRKMTFRQTRVRRKRTRVARILHFVLFTTSLLAIQATAQDPNSPPTHNSSNSLNVDRLKQIDLIIEQGLAERKMPGAVVLIGHNGQIVFHRAYGFRQLQPTKIAMTTDTLFDMASITKPVATATSIMMLVERGEIRLRNRVETYIPEFAQNGKDAATITDLLLHQGGFIPDNALKDYVDGKQKAFERIYALSPIADPGTMFKYSDVGFLILADLVERTSGQNIHDFTREQIFVPLGMSDTGFLPNKRLRQRAATTQEREGRWMQGEVHDPRAYALDGVAGHAGLFSTSSDLAIYAQMMLNGGTFGDVRILSRRGVEVMTQGYPVSSGIRGLGWDKKTAYSSNRGELFTDKAFGHGGFTGTSLWIDPGLDLFVIFLSNRVHPDGKGYVNEIAGTIGTIAAAAIESSEGPNRSAAHGIENGFIASSRSGDQENKPVLCGIDVLQRDGFKELWDQRIGLITNHTGVNRHGVSDISILNDAAKVSLVKLFSPEHGIAGKLDVARISNSEDESTGLEIVSLYGETRKPSAEMLAGVDTLVFDIQDIGTRFYTYISTMGYAMQAASEHGRRFIVLDRPNPINGIDVQGPVLDADQESFIGFHQIPVRHGMTVGELAQLFKKELDLDLDLHVIQCEHWRREAFFDKTGLTWINPSPNMRSLTQALLYPGIGLLETTNLSVGRGTDTPFELIGAPWIDGPQLAWSLNRLNLTGVRFVPVRFTPESSKFKDQPCQGVNLIITDRKTFAPLRTGLSIATTLHEAYPKQWDTAGYGRLLGDAAVLEGIMANGSVRELESLYADELVEFLKRREPCLIYR